jgi:hypothetical protein
MQVGGPGVDACSAPACGLAALAGALPPAHGLPPRTCPHPHKHPHLLTAAVPHLVRPHAGILPEELDLYGPNKGKVHLAVRER